MEKKIDKKFYLLSAINIVPAMVLGGGLTLDSLVLIGALIALVINHSLLVKIVQTVTTAAGDQNNAGQSSVVRILMLLGLKFLVLFGLIALIYVYKKELITKLFMIIFFQLIIQLVSIKNNYQNS